MRKETEKKVTEKKHEMKRNRTMLNKVESTNRKCYYLSSSL